MPAPASRVTRQRQAGIGKVVSEVAKALSKELGFGG